LPVTLGPILDHVPAWLMVLFRLTGIFILAPMLGSVTIPRQVKVFLVLSLSFAVYPMLLEPDPDPSRRSAVFVGQVVEHGVELWTLAGRVALELLIGFTIGYAASLPLVAMQIGGQLIDQQMGLGFAGLVNPEIDGEAGVISHLLFFTALAVFLLVGGHHVMFGILIASFDYVPLGGFDRFTGLLEMIVGLLALTFELALRIAAPLLCLKFLESVTMGFLARTVPQLNILSVGFVIRILLGTTFLIAFVTVAFEVYRDHLSTMMGVLFGFFTR